MSFKKGLFVLILALCMANGYSQPPCTSLGQTPETAFPVCGTSTFVQNTVPICGVTPIPTNCGGGVYQNRNPYWYRFTCFTSGTLGFVLDPINDADDYDWVIFDVTGRNPADVFADITLNIAENWSANPGNTGAANNTNGLRHCAGNTPNFSSLVNITAGRVYLLMVSNWSASQQGYSLTFTGGTAVITDPLLPLMQSATANCSGTEVKIRFNKKMRCNSLAANGSDFVIAGATVTAASGFGCNTSFDLDSISLTLSAPLAPGNYVITVANGTDGNTLLDNCGTGLLTGSTIPFTVLAQSPLPMGTVTPPPCTPASLTLTFPDPLLCSSIAANGSDFLITGPSAVTVLSATAVNCNTNNETSTITLQLAAPILTGGNYQLQVTTGTDGNTLAGQCNRQVPAGSVTAFILPAQPPLPMGTVTDPPCAPTFITLNFTDPMDCTSISPDGSEFVITGPSGVTVIAATGECNTNPNLRTITIHFSAPVIVSGTYQLQVRNGTDGNTIRGDCNRYVVIGDFTTFRIPDVPPPLMDSLVPVSCSPSSLRLIFDQPVRCTSIAADGSDFMITGPSAVVITSATGPCNGDGAVTQVDIQLASPVVVGGTYQLQLMPGSDGNTLLTECYRSVPPATLNFIVGDTVSAEFQYQVQYDCETDVISFSHNGLHNVNQWEWTVNGTLASASQTFTQSFSASSQNVVQLNVSNGMCNDTHTENIILDNKVIADFTAPAMFCPEDTVLFVDKSAGQIDTWQWSFGNGNTSSLQTPQAQHYPLTGIETVYNVTLTVSNGLGCSTSASKPVKVFGSCLIAVPTAFTPNNDGLNDFLYPLNAYKADHLDFKVFNRWGQLVFHSRDWTKKWDGKINGIPQGTNTFAWMLNYTHRDTKVKYSLKGTTTLIR